MKRIKNLKQRISQALMSFAQDLAKGFRIGIGFLLAIGTGGLLAVAVTGTFNTFSSGSVMKASEINANFATLKAAIEGIPTQQSMRLISETDLTSTQNSITVNGLDGNTDLTYLINTRIVSATSGCSYGIRPNNISSGVYGNVSNGSNGGGPTNYVARDTSQTFLNIGSNGASAGNTNYSSGILYAKTGFSRMLLQNMSTGMAPSSISVSDTMNRSTVWNDTTTNITSLVFVSDVVNCFASGSHIEVWARR
jgi:hypothetical protein